MANKKRNIKSLEANKNTKGPQKPPQKVAESPRRRVSRGRQRYQLVSDIKKEQEAYEAQVA